MPPTTDPIAIAEAALTQAKSDLAEVIWYCEQKRQEWTRDARDKVTKAEARLAEAKAAAGH